MEEGEEVEVDGLFSAGYCGIVCSNGKKKIAVKEHKGTTNATITQQHSKRRPDL